uniref:LuxR C-terminal-related transcriptional regulator n=1 Tax=Serratia quinivorans TaxID=137545 RepID=UPI0035C66F09
MKNCHVITKCNFTRVAIRQLIASLPLPQNEKDDLLVIDIRYDLSLIELLLRLKTLRSVFPNQRCLFLVDASKNTLPDHLIDDYIDSSSSLDVIRKKIKLLVSDGFLRSCWEHYAAIIRSISLTEAQILVVRDITSGMSTHQIAKKHTLSVKTVYSHASNIKKKLKISNRYNLFHYLSINASVIKITESETSIKL